jgi:hypothetical protein
VAVEINANMSALDALADTLEKKGFDIGEKLTKRLKQHHEHQRRQKRVRFARIRRLKSGKRRFIGKRPPIEKAQVPGKSFAAHFKDIFDE